MKLLEQQKVEIENQFLKEQLSPHFLYNTLSYFYTKIFKVNPEVADGIITLTDILRYTLKMDTEKVRLSLEVEHIENLIKINNIRFNNRLNVVFTKEYEEEDHFQIVPHSLITLVENAFKYGDLLDKDNPIRFTMKADHSGIFFSVQNKKKHGSKGFFKWNGT
ncbi:histidine kinase [Pedobacter lusitanus]|uniref:histidine kinase n=1 Tax=Pedobacter lusitanus TaxID=1503925 RepID=UPI0009E58BAD|nr:histidine kinase [Pedobacter lusitanus]